MTSSRQSKYVVDAHALIWYVEGNSRLGAEARRVLSDQSSELFVPITALAEACWTVEHGRTQIPSVARLLADIDADPRITLVPLDRAILDVANTLIGVGEMHDRQIVATALNLAQDGSPVTLLTLDENVRRSGVIPTLW